MVHGKYFFNKLFIRANECGDVSKEVDGVSVFDDILGLRGELKEIYDRVGCTVKYNRLLYRVVDMFFAITYRDKVYIPKLNIQDVEVVDRMEQVEFMVRKYRNRDSPFDTITLSEIKDDTVKLDVVVMIRSITDNSIVIAPYHSVTVIESIHEHDSVVHRGRHTYVERRHFSTSSLVFIGAALRDSPTRLRIEDTELDPAYFPKYKKGESFVERFGIGLEPTKEVRIAQVVNMNKFFDEFDCDYIRTDYIIKGKDNDEIVVKLYENVHDPLNTLEPEARSTVEYEVRCMLQDTRLDCGDLTRVPDK